MLGNRVHFQDQVPVGAAPLPPANNAAGRRARLEAIRRRQNQNQGWSFRVTFAVFRLQAFFFFFFSVQSFPLRILVVSTTHSLFFPLVVVYPLTPRLLLQFLAQSFSSSFSMSQVEEKSPWRERYKVILPWGTDIDSQNRPAKKATGLFGRSWERERLRRSNFSITIYLSLRPKQQAKALEGMVRSIQPQAAQRIHCRQEIGERKISTPSSVE